MTGGPVRLESVVTGSGEPVTLFVPGLTSSVAQTRPFGSGVAGSRVFVDLPGHGGSVLPTGADGARAVPALVDVATAVAAVAREHGATRAVGVSLGAGALVTALAAGVLSPDRLVLLLPPAPARPGTAVRWSAMARALDAGDVEGLARLLRDLQPTAVARRPAVALWARRHAADLVAQRSAGLADVLRGAAGLSAPDGLPRLGASGPDTLVVGQEGDEVHPADVARQWARSLGARCEILPAGAVPWTGRDRLRALITGHLDGRARSGDCLTTQRHQSR